MGHVGGRCGSRAGAGAPPRRALRGTRLARQWESTTGPIGGSRGCARACVVDRGHSDGLQQLRSLHDSGREPDPASPADVARIRAPTCKAYRVRATQGPGWRHVHAAACPGRRASAARRPVDQTVIETPRQADRCGARAADTRRRTAAPPASAAASVTTLAARSDALPAAQPGEKRPGSSVLSAASASIPARPLCPASNLD
jgi:hypothetical protein